MNRTHKGFYRGANEILHQMVAAWRCRGAAAALGWSESKFRRPEALRSRPADKPASEADTIQTILALFQKQRE